MADARSTGGLTSIVSWRGVMLGFGTAAGLAAGLGMVGAQLGWQDDLGRAASLEFVALLVGGYVAGRQPGRVGVIQGLAVATIFILVAASIKAWVEIDLAGRYGPHVLGPMDMGGLILGDLIHLTAACAGGWLADTQKIRAARRQTSPSSRQGRRAGAR